MTTSSKALLTTLLLTLVATSLYVTYNSFASILQAPATIEQPVINQETAPAAPTVNKKQISKLKINMDNTVLVFGVINESAVQIANKIGTLSDSATPIVLLINSPGGSVLDGAQIVSAIEASKAPVYTVCLQFCASMAAIIHQYGNKRLMVDRSMLMMHNAAGGFEGTFPQINSRFSVFTRFMYKMDAKIAARAGLTLDTFLNMQASELWLDAEDSVAKKFADGLVSLDLSNINSTAFNVNEQSSNKIISEWLNNKVGDL